MNSYISSIIDSQFKEFHTFDDNILDSLGDEEVFLKHESGGVVVVAKTLLSQSIMIRLNLVLPYIGQSIVKYVPIGSGIILCLGDILQKSYNKNFPVICFSKKQNTNAFLIPNIDFFTKSIYSDLRTTAQDSPFQHKQNKSLFIGASTGDFDNNTRVKYGISCIDNHQHSAYLSFLCQHPEPEWIEKYPQILSLLHSPISVQEQLKNKIVVNIDGNTVCWSRLYWQMNSSSVPVYINPCENQIQFFDYIDKTNCYMKCSLDNCFSTYDYILDSNNLDEMLKIISNGQQYCKNLFDDYLNRPDEFLQEIIDSILQTFFSHT
jgi:hypothetical protein